MSESNAFQTPKHMVNVCLEVDWQQGGKSLISEAFAMGSDEPLFSVAEQLRDWAEYLDDLSQKGVRTPEDDINV